MNFSSISTSAVASEYFVPVFRLKTNEVKGLKILLFSPPIAVSVRWWMFVLVRPLAIEADRLLL
jgi:hypothetical protein